MLELQVVPGGVTATEPLPIPERFTVSVYDGRLNAAPTVVFPLTVNEQVLLVPLHGPDHAPNTEPEVGGCDRVMTVPLGKEAAHVAPHATPPGLDVTVPVPSPVRLTVTV